MLLADISCLYSLMTTICSCSIFSKSPYSSLLVVPSPPHSLHSQLSLISAFMRCLLHPWHCALCTERQPPTGRTFSDVISLSAFHFTLLALHHITLQKHYFSNIPSHSLSSSPPDTHWPELLHTQKLSFLILGTSSWERRERINIQCSRGGWFM